jgi:hypothetical protein
LPPAGADPFRRALGLRPASGAGQDRKVAEPGRATGSDVTSPAADPELTEVTWPCPVSHAVRPPLPALRADDGHPARPPRIQEDRHYGWRKSYES